MDRAIASKCACAAAEHRFATCAALREFFPQLLAAARPSGIGVPPAAQVSRRTAMGVATEDAEEQAFSWNIGNKLRLTCWANASDGTASNRFLSASAFSAYSACSAVISIAAFRVGNLCSGASPAGHTFWMQSPRPDGSIIPLAVRRPWLAARRSIPAPARSRRSCRRRNLPRRGAR